jgi:acyl carrier protein
MLNPNQVRKAAQEVVAEMIGKKVGDADSLISSGLIDSLSILKLIGNLENRLSVTIPAGDLQPDDFESVDFITDTVLRVARDR